MSDTGSFRVRYVAPPMRDRIGDYTAGRTSVTRLATDLKGGLAILRQFGADDEWVDELKSTWNRLEYVNAFFIESGRTTLTDEECDDVADTLAEMDAAFMTY